MSLASSLLCLMITSIPAQVEKQAAMPDRLRGQFLDLFDGDKIQLSIGSDQGVRTGLTGFVIRTSPEPHSYGAEVEFVEVDGKHSIAKIRSHHSPYGPVYDNPYAIGLTLISPPFAKGSFGASVKSVKNNRLKVNDSFDWHSAPPWNRQPIEYARQPGQLHYGGAVIDLTTSEGRSILPRR